MRLCLNQLPGIEIEGEILHEVGPKGVAGMRNRDAVVRHLQRAATRSDDQRGGGKLTPRAMECWELNATDLRQLFPRALPIVLYRRSMADQYLSKLVAVSTGRFTRKVGDDRHVGTPKLRVDPAHMLAYLERMRRLYERVAHDPWIAEAGLVVSYEQFTSDPITWFETQAFPRLGLGAGTPIPAFQLTKQRSWEPEDVVENFGEIAGAAHRPSLGARPRSDPVTDPLPSPALPNRGPLDSGPTLAGPEGQMNQ